MLTLRIVEAIGVVEYVSLCLLVRAIHFARFTPGRQRGEKVLDRRIVPYVM